MTIQEGGALPKLPNTEDGFPLRGTEAITPFTASSTYDELLDLELGSVRPVTAPEERDLDRFEADFSYSSQPMLSEYESGRVYIKNWQKYLKGVVACAVGGKSGTGEAAHALRVDKERGRHAVMSRVQNDYSDFRLIADYKRAWVEEYLDQSERGHADPKVEEFARVFVFDFVVVDAERGYGGRSKRHMLWRHLTTALTEGDDDKFRRLASLAAENYNKKAEWWLTELAKVQSWQDDLRSKAARDESDEYWTRENATIDLT